jgi:hypothetical protein
MIADMQRVVQVLCWIATYRPRRRASRIFDRSDAHYPILTRTLAARRANDRGAQDRDRS